MKKDLSTMSLVLLISLFVLSISQPAQAQNQQKTHIVQTGETLFSISRQFQVSVDQLRTWNNLDTSNELKVGQELIVSQPDSAQSAAVITHTVKPQETLFSISKQYGVSISAIRRWNDLSGNNLEVGQQLSIYPSNSQASATADSMQTTSLVANTTKRDNTYYIVKSGDTLYQIAEAHNMSLDELKSLNDLTSSTIRVGQQLTVRKTAQSAPSVAESAGKSSPQGAFVIYSVQRGSSLNQILQQFDMTEAELKALNPDIPLSQLKSGQQITVLLPPTAVNKNPYTTKANIKNLGKIQVSSYGMNQAGTTTTSGELYNPDQLTAAHSNIALGNVIFVQNPQNNKGIYVRINDRFSGNGLKLSKAAIQALGITSTNATVNMYQDQ